MRTPAAPVADERDITNNCSAAARLRVGREDDDEHPDLAVTALRADPAAAAPSGRITLHANVQNIGAAAAPAADLAFERRNGAVWTTVGRTHVPQLPAGRQHAAALATTAPARPDRYEYRACASRLREERNIANNCSPTINVEIGSRCTVTSLGTAGRELRTAASWRQACSSPRGGADGARAAYYSFTLQATATVRIGLSVRARAALTLIAGSDPRGPLITASAGADPRIARMLGPGTYMIEARETQRGAETEFVLRVRPGRNWTAGMTAGSPIRAVHLTELRERVDEVLTSAGLPARQWTDPLIIPGETPVKAIHLTELRNGIARAYREDRREPPVWEAQTRAGDPIESRHFENARRAVDGL